MSETQAQSGINQWSAKIALFAMVCVLLSWAALNLETHLVVTRILNRESISMSLPELTEQLLWLCPIPVLILLRRIVRIAVPYALVFLVIVAGHCYYLLKFSLVGVNAFRGAFQWPALLQSVAGRISVAVIVIWMIIKLTIFLSDTLKNQNGADTDG